MPHSMRYTDAGGQRRILTADQAVYLDTAWRQFDRGWGGLSSTLTVRLLHARGLLLLDDFLYRDRGWRVVGRTRLGEQVIDEWRRRAQRE